MQKLITFVVACYNSAEYMHRCIDTILPVRDISTIEIILVNDGSTDATGEICDRYKASYPDIFTVVHQENGGHGEGINQGIRHATGLYFKVVDSDDWLDTPALMKTLETLQRFPKDNLPDMIVCNYVYDHQENHTLRAINYRNVFPRDRNFEWADTKPFKATQYLLMHSIIYRTEILRECGLVLPKHTFYVDNIFVICPLAYVKSIYYLDVNLYHYMIGRSDQSVNESVMVKRVDQQLLITKIILTHCDLIQQQRQEPELSRYINDYGIMMIYITLILLAIAGDEASEQKRNDFWRFLAEEHPNIYSLVKTKRPGKMLCYKGKIGRKFVLFVYKVVRKIYPFN